MGAAKRRGTYEERRQSAIERNRKEREEQQRKRLEAWQAMTPEEREAERQQRSETNNLMAMLGGMLAGSMGSLSGPGFWGPPRLKDHHKKRR